MSSGFVMSSGFSSGFIMSIGLLSDGEGWNGLGTGKPVPAGVFGVSGFVSGSPGISLGDSKPPGATIVPSGGVDGGVEGCCGCCGSAFGTGSGSWPCGVGITSETAARGLVSPSRCSHGQRRHVVL